MSDTLKKNVAQASLKYIEDGMIVGVGTGSTVNFFIEFLATIKHRIEGAIPSSVATEHKLRAHHIPLCDLNAVPSVDIYVDGADEANSDRLLIKGRGGALLREKIIATIAQKFVCLIDESKRVDVLGRVMPIPIEVIPMARSYVGRQIVKLGGDPVYREGYRTDNGNVILDIYNLVLIDPFEWERVLNTIVGVVENGIFAHRAADVILQATQVDGVVEV